MLGARGSGDTGYGATVDTAITALRSTYKKPVDTMSLPYPADTVDELLGIFSSSGPFATLGASVNVYFASVNDGVGLLTSELAAQERDCPNRPIVMIGYSQGALVVNRALVALGAAHNPVLGQIAAVELLADPQRLANSPYLDGTAPTTLSGISVALGRYPADQLPPGVTTEIGSWCQAGDLVCAPSASVALEVAAFLLGGPITAVLGLRHLYNNAKRIHTSYATNGDARSAGVQAAHLLRASNTASRARAELTALTPGLGDTIVAVPGGYEAAAYDQTGDLSIWHFTNQWQQVAQSTYPAPAQFGAIGGISVEGGVPTGMHDAVFIVHGPFSGDGSGQAAAYTNGPIGWGAIVAEPNGNIGSTGSGITDNSRGVELGMRFQNGQFQTLTDWATAGFPQAFAAAFPIIRDWNWTGQDFALVSDTIFTAQDGGTSTSANNVPALPAGPPPDGTWQAQLDTTTANFAQQHVFGSTVNSYALTVESGIEHAGCLAGGTCFQAAGATETLTASPEVKTTIPVLRPDGSVATVTAPPWVLTNISAIANDDLFHGTLPIATFFDQRGMTPYYVPDSLGAQNLYLVDAQPLVNLTYRGGHIVEIDMQAQP